jgi:hypothetical protein
MSLNYDLGGIENYKELLNPEGEPKQVTETLIWLTMTIGLEKITHQNWQDFYLRVYMYEKLFDPFLSTKEGMRPITPKDIQRHIGLKTNSGSISYTQFLKRIYDRASWDLRSEMKEAA